MVYLLYASTPKNNNLYFYGLSPVLPRILAVEATYTLFFPGAIQGRMKASEIDLKKEKGWFQPPKKWIFPYSNNQLHTFYTIEFSPLCCHLWGT